MPVTAASRRGTKSRRTGKRFWREKLVANKQRDRLVNRLLRNAGWQVVRIWEHELHGKRRQRALTKIQRALAIAGPS